MNIQAEGLRIRRLIQDDMENVHALHSLAETDKYNTLGIPADLEATRRLVDDWVAAGMAVPVEKYVFCLESVTGDFVGLLGVNIGKPKYSSAEIWYKLMPEHWGKGYATNAVKAILEFCFEELGLHRVEAGCATGNIASVRVLEKAGFTREGMKRKILPIRGEWVDNYSYAILEEDIKK